MTKKQKSMAAASPEPPKMAVVMDAQRPAEFKFIDDAEPKPLAVDDIRQPLPTPIPAPVCEIRDPLWELYLARVAKAETVNTMRRDGRAIFRDAFAEAKVALDVYLEQTKKGQQS